VLVEGAGSPAEVNLRANDIAQYGLRRAGRHPVVIVGDIERGGVIAQMSGPGRVVDPEDAAMVAASASTNSAVTPRCSTMATGWIAERTCWRGFGLPYFARARELPAEDALGLSEARKPGKHQTRFLALSRSRISTTSIH